MAVVVCDGDAERSEKERKKEHVPFWTAVLIMVLTSLSRIYIHINKHMPLIL